MTSVRIWGPGAGAVAVLVVTGVWAHGSAGVDAGLWAEVRPAVEARLVARAAGTGDGESGPGPRWFCRAEVLDLSEGEGRVRAGIDTLCLEYGERGGALAECAGTRIPQVVRLERDTAHGGYRVVSEEEPPDDDAAWTAGHFSRHARSRLDEEMPSTALAAQARTHFGLPAHAPVRDSC
ncbi:hypothetical protein [Streptomyces sp. NPDC051014]|uniref:hypothetical protein n=1 Tax=Streptomyces sp. NPDC051014 TaxID=3155751 RepID=UPI0033CB1B91